MPAYYGRCAFEGHHTPTGALVTNVLHLEVDVLTDPPNWGNIATDVHNWLGALWVAVLATDYEYDQLVVTDENYPGSTHGQGVHVANAVGTRIVSDTDLDRAICVVASFKTAVAKRYGRGHIFMPPAEGTTALASQGTFNTSNAYWTTCGAFVNAYVAGHTVSSTGYSPIVFSRTRVNESLSPYTFPIVGVSMKQQQHFLRSRSGAP